MKVFICADIEGATGVVSWSQCGRPDSSCYDYKWAREQLASDVNAAIRGAKRAGATEIVVKDSHGNSKNLLIDMLEPGVQLISGHGARQGGMMIGIDRTFDAAMLIGHHAMAGTKEAILEHTLTGAIHRMWINEMPAGEIALNTAVAGCFQVPVVCVTSDTAGCLEAEALIPNVSTAVVKEGFGRYMGHLRRTAETAPLIESAAETGLKNVALVDPWIPASPMTVRIEFKGTENADMAAKLVGSRRVDGYTISYSCDTWAEAHQAVWQIVTQAGLGASHDK